MSRRWLGIGPESRGIGRTLDGSIPFTARTAEPRFELDVGAPAKTPMSGPEEEILPPVSVVIPTRNRARLLLEVFEALGHQKGIDPARLDVVVVDDGSTEAVGPAVASLATPFRVRVLRQPHSGVGKARNAGWAAATGDVILFLDDDVLPAHDLVAGHLRVHATNPRVVVLGAISTDPARGRDAWTAYEDSVRVRKYRALAGREVPSGIHYGGNFSIRRLHLETAGGFDGALFSNQDVDLGVRFRRLGLDFVFEPAATGVHRGRRDLETWKLMHAVRGRLDVAMFRDRGYTGGLLSLVACYHDRHPLNRLAVRTALTSRGMERRMVGAGLSWGLAAHRLGLASISRAAMSATANVIYWAGVRDGLRGGGKFWELVRQTRRYTGRPYELGASRSRM